jgi:hypothetical protein
MWDAWKPDNGSFCLPWWIIECDGLGWKPNLKSKQEFFVGQFVGQNVGLCSALNINISYK